MLDPADPPRVKAGFDFFFPASFPAVEVETEFDLGSFLHLNLPIGPPIETGAQSVDLHLGISGTVLATSKLFTALSTTRFDIEETPNADDVGECPDFQFSATPCDDRITTTLLAVVSTPLIINGKSYVFSISGFAVGEEATSVFVTAENGVTRAALRGIITADVGVIPRPPRAFCSSAASPALVCCGGAGAADGPIGFCHVRARRWPRPDPFRGCATRSGMTAQLSRRISQRRFNSGLC